MTVRANGGTLALAIGLGALLLATPAVAGKGSKDKNADDPNRRVCRSITQTGTRFPTRVCKTAADWEEEMRKTQDSALAHQRDNSGGSEGFSPR